MCLRIIGRLIAITGGADCIVIGGYGHYSYAWRYKNVIQ